MDVGQAKEIVPQWVCEEGRHLPGFAGAFFHGSVIWLPDDAPLPAASDVDVMVVIDDASPPQKIGKLRHRGILLEASYLPLEHLQTAEQVLGQYQLAGSLRAASVILDQTEALAPLQTAVARDFANRRWVWRRCEHALTKIESGLHLDPAAPFHDQVIAWLFPTGITTHVLLTAGLRNPTVRTRYLAARSLLADFRRLDLYQTLLELLGCSELTQDRSTDHLDALTDAFDAVKAVVASPFFFASDITDLARPVATDGSRELIERGDRREAVFWLVATYALCQTIF